MADLGIVPIFRKLVAEAKGGGDYALLAGALRSRDVNHDGMLSWSELASTDYIANVCPRATRVDTGYRCDYFPGIVNLPESVAYNHVIQYNVALNLKDYAGFRVQHGRGVADIAVAAGSLSLGLLNKELAREHLPVLSPALLKDAMNYTDAHLGEFRATGYVPLPAPKGVPVHDERRR